MPNAGTASRIAIAQRIARCGPSNIARKPSPEVFTSRPRKRASCERTTASCASSNACQSRSPISAARRVESTMSVNSTVASTRSSTKSAWCPVRNSAISWNDDRQSGSTKCHMLRFVEPDWRSSFQEIAEFLTGHQADLVDDRVLATVLFTDIVDSTRRAADMGDRDWHALLDAHDAVIRSQLARFRGREVNTSGDGFLAMFDGPQRAIRCAMAIRDAVQA